MFPLTIKIRRESLYRNIIQLNDGLIKENNPSLHRGNVIPHIAPFFNRNGNTAPMERRISASSRSFCVKRALSICYSKRNERYLKVSILPRTVP